MKIKCSVENEIDAEDLAKAFSKADPEYWQIFFIKLNGYFTPDSRDDSEGKLRPYAKQLSKEHGASSKHFIFRLNNLIKHYELLEK